MQIIGEDPPPKPVDGDLWFNLNNQILYVFSGQMDGWFSLESKIPTVQTKEQFEQWAVDAVTQ